MELLPDNEDHQRMRDKKKGKKNSEETRDILCTEGSRSNRKMEQGGGFRKKTTAGG